MVPYMEIGEVKIFDRRRIRCVEDNEENRCSRCCFDGSYVCFTVYCFHTMRKDHKNVRFEIRPTRLEQRMRKGLGYAG